MRKLSGAGKRAVRRGAETDGRAAAAGGDCGLGLESPAVKALIAIDGDCLDERPDGEVSAVLGTDEAGLARMRALVGYWDAVREHGRGLFCVRDRKAVWNAYVCKAKAGDARVCERLLEEVGGWLEPSSSRKAAQAVSDRPEVRVIIRGGLVDGAEDGAVVAAAGGLSPAEAAEGAQQAAGADGRGDGGLIRVC